MRRLPYRARIAAPLMALVLHACTDNAASNSPAAPATAAGGTGTSGDDLLITGQLAVNNLSPAVSGSEGVSLSQREVKAKDASGNVIASTYTAADGTYVLPVPGSLVISTEAGKLRLASGSGAQIEALITDTADQSVIGFQENLDLTQASGRVLKLGATELEKVTAIRGVATLDGAQTHTGILAYVPGTIYSARTDAAGNYLMAFIPAGPYKLRFEKDGFKPVEVDDISVSESETTRLNKTILTLSGGTTNVTVKQVGTQGISTSRRVEFFVEKGTADRFKAGLAADLESLPYQAPPEVFTYDFPADGTYVLKFQFADADGFESLVERTIVVDTVKPLASGVSLVDRSTLSSSHTNERQVIAYHSNCSDIDSIAILPATATAPKETDFSYKCYTAASNDNSFSIPTPATTYGYKIWVKDRVGNQSELPVSGSIIFDATPPAPPALLVTDQTSGSSAGTDITTVNLTMTSCSDVEYIHVSESQLLPPNASAFSLACSTTANFSNYTFSNNIPGNKIIIAWAVDNAGNVGPIASTHNIVLDTVNPTAPSFTLADPTPTAASYSNSLSLIASPAHCNDTTHILVREAQTTAPDENDAGWQACSTSGVTVSALADGNRTLYLWARDIGGRISAAATTASILVDATPPTAPSFSLVDQSSTRADKSSYTNGDVALSISSCGDADKVYISESSSAPSYADFTVSCASTIAHTFSSAANGTKTVYLWARDLAGNISSTSTSAQITLDTDLPSLPGTFTLKDSSSLSLVYTNATSVSYTLDTCPTGAVTLIRESQSSAPSENDSDWLTCGTTGTVSLSSGDATKTVYLWTRDVAGNMSSSSLSDSIILDTASPTAPTLTLVDTGGGSSSGYTNSLTLDVNLSSCADISALLFTESASQPAESSIASSCATSGNPQWTFTGSAGTKRLYVWVKDAAGNMSSSYGEILYDTSTPTISNVRVTALGTDRMTVRWTTDESIYTTLNYDTASNPGTYASTYNVASAVSSHTASLTGLGDFTSYYFKASATDFAEHNSLSSEFNAKTVRLTKLFQENNLARMGGLSSVDPVAQSNLSFCDVNADGRDDLVVGAPDASVASVSNSGAVYVRFGSTTFSSSYNIPTNASITYYVGTTGARIGGAVRCFDYNGDGNDDLLIGPGTWGSTAAYVVLGGSGIATGEQLLTTVRVSSFSLGYMNAFETADFDGDNYDDVMACSNTSCSVYYGAASPAASPTAAFSITHGTGNSAFVSAGDIDGDGYADILVGQSGGDGESNSATNAGVILVYPGRSSRPSGTVLNTTTWTTPSATAYEIHGPAAGSAIYKSFVGSLDSDTYGEVFVEANSKLYVLFGHAAASWSSDKQVTLSSSNLRFVGFGSGSRQYLSTGDIDGDGYNDLWLGDYSEGSTGQACLFFGRSQAAWTTLAAANIADSDNQEISASDADFCVKGADSGDELGIMTAIGNFDGSGAMELGFSNGKGDGSTDMGNEPGEAGILYWTKPSSYQNFSIEMSPHF